MGSSGALQSQRTNQLLGLCIEQPRLEPVSIKWQKETFRGVEIDTSQPSYVFKCQLYDLTGVPPKRQKIMVKGGLLKDDADWSTLGVKEGQKLMMMGKAHEIVNSLY